MSSPVAFQEFGTQVVADNLSFLKIISERIGDVTAQDWHYCDLTGPLDRPPQWRVLLE
jgi:hypothetical protein